MGLIEQWGERLPEYARPPQRWKRVWRKSCRKTLTSFIWLCRDLLPNGLVRMP